MKLSTSNMEKSENCERSVQADESVSLTDCLAPPAESDVFSSEKTEQSNEADELLEETKLNVCDSLSCSLMSEGKCQSKKSPKLVQHCGPDCLMSQRIVDKLLSRMMKLENERSELHAANRSWSVQYKLMKEHYVQQVECLKEEVKSLKKEKHDVSKRRDEERLTKSCSALSTSDSQQDRLDLLTHQAQIYKEDFLEERKARARAHSQIEALKAELKRERKSRAKLASLVQQNPVSCEKAPTMISTSN